MSDQQILTKAIQKAIDGGWQIPSTLSFVSNNEFLVYLTQSSDVDLKWLKFKCTELIFNHDFAKALWGVDDGLRCDVTGCPGELCTCGKDFRYHLQQMVIADDPIKYLEENI